MTDKQDTPPSGQMTACPFCGATPHRGPTKVEYCQLHGDPFQRYRLWCPHGCATILRQTEAEAIAAWNTRPQPPAPASGGQVTQADKDALWAIRQSPDTATAYQRLIDYRIAAERTARPDGVTGEPVAWMYEHPNREPDFSKQRDELLAANAPPAGEWTETPLYANPPVASQQAPGDDSGDLIRKIALALLNEGRRYMGLKLVESLDDLQPHQYCDDLRKAKAALAVILTPSTTQTGES